MDKFDYQMVDYLKQSDYLSLGGIKYILKTRNNCDKISDVIVLEYMFKLLNKIKWDGDFHRVILQSLPTNHKYNMLYEDIRFSTDINSKQVIATIGIISSIICNSTVDSIVGYDKWLA